MRYRTSTYTEHLRSESWRQKRADAILRARSRCEQCGALTPRLEVHHLHYDTLGDELPEDLKVLCVSCHKEADGERAEETKQRLYEARLNGWATKKYGPNWELYGIAEDIVEEFDEWLDGREG